jgi:hypothetical protein
MPHFPTGMPIGAPMMAPNMGGMQAGYPPVPGAPMPVPMQAPMPGMLSTPMKIPMPVPMAQTSAPAPDLDVNVIAAMSEESKVEYLGNILYPKIEEITGGEQAPKVTGMLLDQNVGDVIEIIQSPALLKKRVTEAMALLTKFPSS